MSLFEDANYRWRETFFVLFPARNRPTARSLRDGLHKVGLDYDARSIRSNSAGLLESCTLVSNRDHSAMDVTCVAGEEAVEQRDELLEELRRSGAAAGDREKLRTLAGCDARFDVFHFQQVTDDEEELDDDLFDPGSLLIVLGQLSQMCDGVAVDPQSGAFL